MKKTNFIEGHKMKSKQMERYTARRCTITKLLILLKETSKYDTIAIPWFSLFGGGVGWTLDKTMVNFIQKNKLLKNRQGKNKTATGEWHYQTSACTLKLLGNKCSTGMRREISPWQKKREPRNSLVQENLMYIIYQMWSFSLVGNNKLFNKRYQYNCLTI